MGTAPSIVLDDGFGKDMVPLALTPNGCLACCPMWNAEGSSNPPISYTSRSLWKHHVETLLPV